MNWGCSHQKVMNTATFLVRSSWKIIYDPCPYFPRSNNLIRPFFFAACRVWLLMIYRCHLHPFTVCEQQNEKPQQKSFWYGFSCLPSSLLRSWWLLPQNWPKFITSLLPPTHEPKHTNARPPEPSSRKVPEIRTRWLLANWRRAAKHLREWSLALKPIWKNICHPVLDCTFCWSNSPSRNCPGSASPPHQRDHLQQPSSLRTCEIRANLLKHVSIY